MKTKVLKMSRMWDLKGRRNKKAEGKEEEEEEGGEETVGVGDNGEDRMQRRNR